MFNVIWLVCIQFVIRLRSQLSLSSISATDFEANNKTVSSTYTVLCTRPNFAEIRQKSRISANKLRTFVSDENSAKLRRIYCNVTEQCSRTLGRSFMHVKREQKRPKDGSLSNPSGDRFLVGHCVIAAGELTCCCKKGAKPVPCSVFNTKSWQPVLRWGERRDACIRRLDPRTLNKDKPRLLVNEMNKTKTYLWCIPLCFGIRSVLHKIFNCLIPKTK